MKLLRVRATNYKNCCDNFTIDFVAKSNKTSEDKEYELHEIAENLYVCNTAAIVGKNASGKTSAIELLEACYRILEYFRLENDTYNYDNVALEIIFYHNQYIYKYNTILKSDSEFENKTKFTEQHIYKKKHFKSKIKTIFNDNDFEEVYFNGSLPEDTSILFFVLNAKILYAKYFDCNGEGVNTYNLLFRAIKTFNIAPTVLKSIIKIFDNNIQNLSMLDEKHYKLTYNNITEELSDTELIHRLSSGTTKGVLLYVFMYGALKTGFDLLIDEIENHFHKTLVENMISLFKDKSVNKHSATLIFTTHYCELLDLFNRQDNIWIAKAEDKIQLENMYEQYDIRPELLKSRQFYNDTFKTAVNYEDLMALKKELMKWRF